MYNGCVIVVIGAGAAGLASAAMLQRAGERVVVLERASIGAPWASRYDRLHLHTVRWLSGLPHYRMPRSYGKWPSRECVREYLQRYADRHGLDVRTGVEVERVDRAAAGWTVATAADVFAGDRVVVATGHSNVPFLPQWPGVFQGEIVHSIDYRNPAPYQGRRVLVIGAGNSGAEIAVDVADGGAAATFLAVRTPPNIIRRDTSGFPSQVIGVAVERLPPPLLDRIGAALRRMTVPDLSARGLPAVKKPYSDFLRRRTVPILDVGLIDAVQDGRVRVVAALERFEGGSAVLADGSSVEVDAVIAATGFRTGLEPLVGHLGVLDDRGEPVVHGAQEHPDAPGLHFVGYRVALGGMLRYIGIEAKQLARAVAEQRRTHTTAPV